MTAAKPVVFISSTCEDLGKSRHRAAARDAAIGAGFYPEMKEYWEAKDNLPLNECLERVATANVLVVVVAHRFGWVPEDQRQKDPAKRKSITWLECDQAEGRGKEVLAFLVKEDEDWPTELREKHDLLAAFDRGQLTGQLQEEIKWRVERLAAFKAWLNDRAVRETFVTPEGLQGAVKAALLQWCLRHGLMEQVPRGHDPDKYLRTLREETSHIEIRGL